MIWYHGGWIVVTDAAGASGMHCEMLWGQLQLTSPRAGLKDVYLCNQREGPAWHPGKETNDTALGVDENSHFWLFQPCLGPMRALSRATGRPLTLGVQLFL